ncbi:DUF1998 domain-containing protein [Sporanaerobacter acetigenes]|uniref:MrfA-like Zn-binding domain-containing protein n=1 Tax=Sporanaerobacter acetigenes DSM 13106 TaxID=1123281 RepID=A0A1M5SRT3_9FIRM|nr:DUF1998 domain-containing protein [Sporanaerobacter acetigenes]SHH41127.1 protein of unknown function [Sporanaerobacter acetigenes DSM 13106]
MNLYSNKKKTKKVVGEVRQTQMITTFGCGSLVDLPKASVIIAGTDFWKNEHDEEYIIQEVNLQKLLEVDYFVKPQTQDKTLSNPYAKSRDIPAFRFPETLICSRESCGKIGNYKIFKFNNVLKCPICGNRSLIPSRFVVACENGHIEDFPYDWWVHQGETDCENPDLRLFYRKETGGLDSIVIWCKTCGRSRSMKYSFSKNSLKGYPCSGNRPWLRDKDKNLCTEPLRTVQRGSTNIYYPNLISALSIPPWSDAIQKELNKYDSQLRELDIKDENKLQFFIEFSQIGKKLKYSKEEIKEQIIYRINNYKDDSPKSEANIMMDEYKAFSLGDNNSLDFVTETEEIPESLIGYIDQIVLAKKIKEVVVLTGFRRIKPGDEFENDNSKVAPLSNKRKNWLPAVEFWGEGIFIKFNKERIRKWEENDQVIKRIEILEHNKERAKFKCNKFSPRYVLLHTFSHLLIRQITLQCGYSASALKERIYTTQVYENRKYEMEGVLIYTASPDSEGSLGGLVSQGGGKNLEKTIKKALDQARWCSSDPLCIQSGGQGLNSLNLAACHSCTLLPETSCEMRNLFLDRATIIGKLENKDIGYFGRFF